MNHIDNLTRYLSLLNIFFAFDFCVQLLYQVPGMAAVLNVSSNCLSGVVLSFLFLFFFAVGIADKFYGQGWSSFLKKRINF